MSDAPVQMHPDQMTTSELNREIEETEIAANRAERGSDEYYRLRAWLKRLDDEVKDRARIDALSRGPANPDAS